MLARRRAHLDRARLRRLAGADAAPPDPDVDAVRERAADLLRADTVTAHLREGLDLYLDEASRDADAEIAERERRSAIPSPSFEGATAVAEDPAERARLRGAWEAFERAVEPARAARGELRADAARRAGARDVAELRERTLAVDLRAVLAEAERVAIAPLDEAVARAARSAAGTPAATLPRVEGVLRRLGSAMGEDPDARGPRVLGGSESLWRTEAIAPPGDRATVVLGTRRGLEGFLDALGAFGAAARATAVSRERGADALAGEHPAWARAAETLFRRLPLDAGFREFAGIREDPLLEDHVRLEAAVAPRLAWAAASVALERDPPARAADGFRRASGREPDPSIRAAAWDRDPLPAAAWLGAMWAVLLEERLRTRWGRRWSVARGASSWLHDVWLAEPDSTPDAMAREAQVGTMTADAVLEACRPPRRLS
ncbi:MAG TPA: hypothetical protein VF139_01215 [Candidatus Polarisedimenticolaceae bacterium]